MNTTTVEAKSSVLEGLSLALSQFGVVGNHKPFKLLYLAMSTWMLALLSKLACA